LIRAAVSAFENAICILILSSKKKKIDSLLKNDGEELHKMSFDNIIASVIQCKTNRFYCKENELELYSDSTGREKNSK